MLQQINHQQMQISPKYPVQLPERKKSLPHPILNDKYEIIKLLGEGMAAKVFLGREIETQKHVAIKVLKKDYPAFCSERITEFEREIGILKNLEHQGIVKMHEGSSDGYVESTKGHVQHNIDYIVMDFERNEMFDFCVDMGAMGEEAGKFFLS